jgi:hypothetical protein
METVATTTLEYANTNYHIVKEELFDPDVIDSILRDTQFSTSIKRHLSSYKKARKHGSRKEVIYHFGKGCESNQIGRLFAKDYEGLQSYPREIRNPLIQKDYWDIDIENCHYWLMRRFCDVAGIKNEAISYYCDNRDNELTRVSSNRDLAKTAFLKTAYGGNVKLYNPDISDTGEEPEGDISLIKEIQKEIQTVINYIKGAYPVITKIATDICKKKKEWADKKGKKIYWNADYTALALTLQTEERKCILAIDVFFKKYERQMDILIHDGGMVRKLENETCFPEQLMRDAEKYIKEQLGYIIHLVNKPIKHNFKVPDKIADVIDDEYASRKFVELMGNSIIKSGEEVYIYNEDKGIWENNDMSFRTAISKNKFKLIFKVITTTGEKICNYGGSEKNVMAMKKWITTSIQENTIIDNSKSKNCLLFNDGWYDMKNDIFYEGFEKCKDKFFMKRIDRKFNSNRNIGLEDEIRKILFVNPLNNPKVGELYSNLIAIAISGNVMKAWPIIVGNPDCGKTLITLCLKYTFGEYVGEFNLNALKFNPRDGNDEAKKLAWLSELINCRICVSNEARMDGKSLDGNQMKALSSGGDSIMLRTNFKDQISVTLMSMFFSFMNDMCPIQPCDKALKERLIFLPFTKSFVNKPQSECNEYEMESDPLLKDKIQQKDWIESFFWVIMKSYNNGIMVEKPKDVLNESDELIIIEDVKLKTLLEEKYEFVSTDEKDGWVAVRDIITYLQENGVKMSDTKIGRELKKIGLKKVDKKVNKKTVTVYFGLKE